MVPLTLCRRARRRRWQRTDWMAQSKDEVRQPRNEHWNMHITICKIDIQEIHCDVCAQLGALQQPGSGMRWERFKRRTYVYLCIVDSILWYSRKPTLNIRKHYLHLKINKNFKSDEKSMLVNCQLLRNTNQNCRGNNQPIKWKLILKMHTNNKCYW